MRYILLISSLTLVCCSQNERNEEKALPAIDRETSATNEKKTPANKEDNNAQPAAYFSGKRINTGNVTPQQLIVYATTLVGTPYKYGSANPTAGFDCSGFITYVFNHFNITVPRSSVDFTHIQTEVSLDEATPGDLILFTGTDSTIRIVGHMGIITSAGNDGLSFIHSTSGKANGVTITPLNQYYMGRFMKIVHVF